MPTVHDLQMPKFCLSVQFCCVRLQREKSKRNQTEVSVQAELLFPHIQITGSLCRAKENKPWYTQRPHFLEYWIQTSAKSKRRALGIWDLCSDSLIRLPYLYNKCGSTLKKTLLFAPRLQLYHFPQLWISLLSSNRHDAYKLGNTHALKLESSTSKCAAIYVKQKMSCVSAAEKGNSFQKVWWKVVFGTCIYSVLFYIFCTCLIFF